MTLSASLSFYAHSPKLRTPLPDARVDFSAAFVLSFSEV